MVAARAAGAGTHLALALALCFSAGGLYGWSAIIPALRQTFAASLEQAGLVFSLAIVAFSVAVYAAPRLPHRLHGLTGAALAGAGGALGLICAAFAPSYPVFLAAFSVGFGAASGAIYILVLDIAASTQRPHVWTPVMVAAFGSGGAVFGPAMRILVEWGWGLRALFILGASLMAFSILSGVFAARANDQRGGVGGTDIPGATWLTDPAPGFVITLLWITLAFGSAAGLMTLGLASTIVESRGASIWLSSAALSGIAIGNTAGRLSVGLLSGTLRPGIVVVLATLIVGTGLVPAAVSAAPGPTALGLVAVAGGYGVVAAGIPTLTRKLFGSAAFGRVYSTVFVAWGIAGLTAPWVAGALFDLSGTFTTAIYAALGLTAIAMVSAIMLCRVEPRGTGRRV